MDIRLQQLKREMVSGNNPEAAQRYWHARIQAGERVLLGLSTSFCIQSILNEHVDPDEIIMVIGSTTGFVEDGKPGKRYEEIVDRYMESYWYKHPRQDVEKVIHSILPRMSEQQHGLPGAWVDASKPYYWGWVPHGNQLGVVGTYLNVETNAVTYSVEDIHARQEEINAKDRFSINRIETIEKEAIPLNLKYGFVKPE